MAADEQGSVVNAVRIFKERATMRRIGSLANKCPTKDSTRIESDPLEPSNAASTSGSPPLRDGQDQPEPTRRDTAKLTWERMLIEDLDAPRLPGETYRALYERKERELVAAFAVLSSSEARALHDRLSTSSANDALAARFARLVPDRRARLLAFLANSPRREARAFAPASGANELHAPGKEP